MSGAIVLAVALAYLSGLFAIAFYADKRAEEGRSLVASPIVYALSIAVYCTSWTFYGSVGRAAQTGLGFLPIYLGPTLVFVLAWIVLRKILTICKGQRITSIADFIASRYGKSQTIAGLVTVIAVLGTIPYIALQLKAVVSSLGVMVQGQDDTIAHFIVSGVIDSALVVTAVLGAFAILFGTRHLEATEHHAGMVVAIAFESIVKLAAFVAVGLFVTYGLFGGFADIFAKAGAKPELAALMSMEKSDTNWVTLTLLAMAAAICLPRQFHITMVENTNPRHLFSASWLFPLYLIAINIFVLPIAFGGRLWFEGAGVDADTYVLALPLAADNHLIALIGFIGGLSAATAMVIVASVALSTMVSNDLVMPALLRYANTYLTHKRDLSGFIIAIRRAAIVLVLLAAYLYYRLIGESYALVAIGLVSFCAAAQLAPAMILGVFWRGGTRAAAMTGLSLGFLVWFYSLFLPSFARSGLLPETFITEGPFGISMLKPYELFGLQGLDNISHALFWSMFFNIGALLVLSLIGRQSRIEQTQATLFVEVFRKTHGRPQLTAWQGSARVADLRVLADRFVGPERSEKAFQAYARQHALTLSPDARGDSNMIQMVERLIAGTIGAASARVSIATAVKGERVSLDEVMQILDETTHVLEYSRELEQKSRELEEATAELTAANERLKELDQLKDEFMSTVSHELRTPLTSIRSFSEILSQDPDLPLDQRQHFLSIIVSESERLTRLINQVLDLSRIEAGRMQWNIDEVDVGEVLREATTSLAPIFTRDGVGLELVAERDVERAHGDHDRLLQVAINLISNAEKFSPKPGGVVTVKLWQEEEDIVVSVADQGPGIPESEREAIFDKFHQVRDRKDGNPLGTGLGLAISQRIVAYLGGRIWVAATGPGGSEFRFTVPVAARGGAEGVAAGVDANA